jgi:hypothetical protein
MAKWPAIRKTGFLVSISVLVVCGCVILFVNVFAIRNTKSSDESERPLKFESLSVDAGLFVRGRGRQEVDLMFTVWTLGEVKIKAIEAECPVCLWFDTDLIGKPLNQNTTYHLRGHVSPRRESGEFVMRALIETIPSSPTELVIVIRGTNVLAPVVVPSEVVVQTTVGKEPEIGLHISNLRSKSYAALAMKDATCDLSGFRVVEKRTKSQPRPMDPRELSPAILDEIDLRLQAPPFSATGVYKRSLILKWEGSEPDTEIPVVLFVTHPLVPAIDKIFCGFLQPKQEWKTKVSLSDRDSNTSIKEVKTSRPCIIAEVVLENGSKMLHLSVVAPSEVGRFEEYIEIVFEDSSLPSLRLPVVFIVTASD